MDHDAHLPLLAALVAIAEIVEDTATRPTRRLDRIVKVLRRAGIHMQAGDVVAFDRRGATGHEEG